jgi:hypothetical protein
VAFFALNYQQGKDTQIAVTAKDYAGNPAVGKMVYHINARSFRKDTINLSDRFFNAKMPDFDGKFPESSQENPLELFLKVNRELRQRDNEAFYGATQKTEKEILWKGAFCGCPDRPTAPGLPIIARTFTAAR